MSASPKKESPKKEEKPEVEAKAEEVVAEEKTKTGKEREEDEADEDALYALSNPDVATKYTTCGEICNKAMEKVISMLKAGGDIYTICKEGDEFIEAEAAKVYNKRAKYDENEKKNMTKKQLEVIEAGGEASLRVIPKGVAFPVCISVDNVAGHFSPMKQDTMTLAAGALVKIDLGVHVDGFITQAAQTVVCPGEDGKVTKVTGDKADVTLAAWTAAEAALRKIEVGANNNDVTAVMKLAADEFKVNGVTGVLGHQLKRNCIDGKRTVINRENPEQGEGKFEKVANHTFKEGEVYCLDVMMSSGEGKVKEVTDFRHTIYKKTENSYMLKTPKGRQFMGEVGSRFKHMPFTLRSIEDEGAARIGIKEAVAHELLHTYPVMMEKKDKFIAQFKFTVLLLGNGTKKITGVACKVEDFESDKKVENEELKKVLEKVVGNKKRRNKKAKEEKKE